MKLCYLRRNEKIEIAVLSTVLVSLLGVLFWTLIEEFCR